MDYNYLAESLAALAGVPVRIYRDGRFLSLHHTRFKPDFAITEEENIFKIAGDVGYYMDPNFLYYGLFRIRGEDIALVIGPVSPFPVSRNLARKILARRGEPVSRTQEVLDYFSVMPAYPLRNFLQILCTIQYFINGEKVSVSSFLLDDIPAGGTGSVTLKLRATDTAAGAQSLPVELRFTYGEDAPASGTASG